MQIEESSVRRSVGDGGPSLESCGSSRYLARQYKISPDHQPRYDRLAVEARTCVPSAIHALRELPTRSLKIVVHEPLKRLIEAWVTYAQVVGVANRASDPSAYVCISYMRFEDLPV